MSGFANLPIMAKYKEEREKAKGFLTHNRDPFSKWTLTSITHLAMVMETKDFYHLLVESHFIDPTKVHCKACKTVGKMHLQVNQAKPDGLMWSCTEKVSPTGKLLDKKPCRGRRSVRTNSWFSCSKLSMPEIMLITYMWWYKFPLRVISNEYGFTDRTLCDWASYCREVAIDAVFNHSEPIGGPRIIVEIDESKFGKSISNYFIQFELNII